MPTPESGSDRSETPDERHDRDWIELRVAQTTLHRALYQRHRKVELVAAGDRSATVGIAFLGATLVIVTFLVFGLTGGDLLGLAAAAVVAALALLLQCALPLRLRA